MQFNIHGLLWPRRVTQPGLRAQPRRARRSGESRQARPGRGRAKGAPSGRCRGSGRRAAALTRSGTARSSTTCPRARQSPGARTTPPPGRPAGAAALGAARRPGRRVPGTAAERRRALAGELRRVRCTPARSAASARAHERDPELRTSRRQHALGPAGWGGARLQHVREQEEQAGVHARAQADGRQHAQADPPHRVPRRRLRLRQLPAPLACRQTKT
jgi:hypothetical protein